eukprot:gene20832-32121_t
MKPHTTEARGLRKKWALVTGANRGIGLAVAKRLCALGLGVVVSVRSNEKRGEVARALEEVCDGNVRPIIMQLTGRPLGTHAGRSVRAALGDGKLVGLVLNAAMNADAPWNPETIQHMVDINYKANLDLFLSLEPLLPPEPESNYGQLKHVADKAVRRSLQHAASLAEVDGIAKAYTELAEADPNKALKRAYPYAMSKNLLAAAVRVLGRSGNYSRVAVNGVHPGSVKTAMNPNGKMSAADAAVHICGSLLNVSSSGSLRCSRRSLRGPPLFVLSNYGQLKHVADNAVRRSLAEEVNGIAKAYTELAEADPNKALKRAYPCAMSKNLLDAAVRVLGRSGNYSRAAVNGVHPGSVKTAMDPNGNIGLRRRGGAHLRHAAQRLELRLP